MKKRIFNKLLPLLALILTMGWMISSCTDERESGSSSNGKDKLVSFSVRVPGAGTPKTYALGDNEENEVKNIVILLFDNNDNYIYQPVYNNKITTDGSNIAIKTFTARVPEGTYKSMVILANANTIVSNALNSINIGDPKASVLEKLTLSNGKWNSNPASGSYMPIPMWGEIANVTVNSSLGEINTSLVRMVAKIDVSLNTTSQGKFKLKSVRLYNYNDKGQIAPGSTNWDATNKEVTAPSVPSSAAKPSNPAQTPFVYDGTAITISDKACIGEIYTFEAEKGTSSNLPGNTCLVVGGYFGSDTQETFYRIDFANTAANGTVTYLDILRNHYYKVVIQDVGARGLATDKDAFNSAPANIKASIVKWNDGKFTEFAINDQYILGLSKGAFTFTREKRDATSLDNILSIMTDYTGGWKITDIVDADTNGTATWLTTDKKNGTNAAGDDVKLLLDENTTGEQRTAHVLVTADAGRLVYKVKVTQDVMPNIGIYITDVANKDISVLEFSAAADVQPDMQQIKLSWAPKVNDVFVTVSAIKNGGFTFVGGSDNITNGSVSDPSGSKIFKIQPPAISAANIAADPLYERSSVILYTLSDGVTTVNKALTIRQFVYNMVPVIEDVYLMDGTRKHFGVRANTPFTVTVKSNPNNVIALRTSSGAANTSAAGTPVYFDIVNDLNNPTLYLKDVVLTISSPQGHFPDTDVTLNCASAYKQEESNSYIVAPGGVGLLIPVSRANATTELGTQLSASDKFSAELVWTEDSKGVANNSNVWAIKAVRDASSVNNSYVLVMPGTAEGNAVVAVRNNTTNKIVWSWHIWVTKYTPTDTWMDRNLGAIGNTQGQVGTLGLLYQWGRKDPFPGALTTNGNDEKPIYNASGAAIAITKTNVDIANNLVNAVNNPGVFYTNTKQPYDWYSNGSTQNNALWGSGAPKSKYDPCPEGYRVPSFNGSTSPWTSLTNQNFAWIPGLGRFTSTLGGFYPASGWRSDGSGLFINVGTSGSYWSGSTYNVWGYSLRFDKSIVDPAKYNSRADGASVRCVKE